MTDNSQNETSPYEEIAKTWLPNQQHQGYDFDVPQGYSEWDAQDNDSVGGGDAGRSAIATSNMADSLHASAALGIGGQRVSGDMHAALEALSHEVQPYTPSFEPQLWHYPAFQAPHVIHDVSSASMMPAYYPTAVDYIPQYHVLPNHEDAVSSGLARPYSQSEDFHDTLQAANHPFEQSDASNNSRPTGADAVLPPPPTTLSLIPTIIASEPRQTSVGRPIKAAIQKAPKKSRHTRRLGPLDASTRMKADEMRDIGACWRCRKYKKPCNGHAGVCASCQVPGFRVWPSELGCRRERLDSLVLFLLPAHMEQKLQSLPEEWARPRTWRVLKVPEAPINFEIPDESIADQWTVSRKQARSLLLFDVDYAELANIAEKYQGTRVKPIRALEASCTLLIAGCKLYQCFVNTPLHSDTVKISEIIKRATAVRVSLRKTFVYIQQLCLSTKRSDWFPAFLSASIAACTAIIFLDIVLAVPSPVREMIWGEAHETISGLRHGGYQLLVDLLKASTNGINPIKQQCWSFGGASKSAELKKSEERHTLLGVDTAAMEGLVALKAWQEKYDPILAEGRAMMAADMYTVARIPPIAGLCKVFDF